MCENHEHHHDEDCCCCECCEEEKELVRDRRELTDEEIESIIVEKYNTKDEKTKVFIRKALKKQGDWYDYSKIEYKDSRTKVTIICPIHKDFEQRTDAHLRGCGCGECANEYVSERFRMTKDEFVKRSNEVHNNKYKYDKANYVNSHTKVKITCLLHGDFEQIPIDHLRGKGCPECAGNKKLNNETFIEKAKLIHNNSEYDYSKVNYVNAKTDVIIHCNKHDIDFSQTPDNHLRGKGCPKCAREKIVDALKSTLLSNTEEFIKKAKLIHKDDRYDYSRVNYINSKTPVEIVCNFHNRSFWQTPHAHLRGSGCPMCNNSVGETLTEKYLTTNGISYEQHTYMKYDTKKMFPDFILLSENENIWIEYNGQQHYSICSLYHKSVDDFKIQLDRDIRKREYCKLNGIKLIEIPYTLKTLESISDFLDKVLLQNIDPNTLVDYSKLYKLDNTGLNLEDLFPT